MTSTWKKQKAQELAIQEDMSREEITNELRATNEYVFDPATAPKVIHRWVDRGLKMSCEGGDHPHHQAFKRLAM